MKNVFKVLLILMLLCHFNNPVYTQQNAVAGSSISDITQKAIVDSIIQLVSKNYILPEKIKGIADALHSGHQSGKYTQAASSGMLFFARQLTLDIRTASSDNHFSVFYQPVTTRNTSSNAADTTYGIQKTEILPGNIAYLKFNYFPPDSATARKKYGSVFSRFRNSDAIIIDLTDNFGGNPRMEVYLCSYFFPEQPRHLWDAYSRIEDSTYQFYTARDIDGPRQIDVPVYVLTGSTTFSAGEALAYDLQAQKRAKIIGETTAGGAHSTAVFDIMDGIKIRLPIAKITNYITKSDWEAVGVKPDINCMKHEAIDMAVLLALKDIVKKTKDATKKKTLNSLINAKEKDQRDFIARNAYLENYSGSYSEGLRKIIYSKGRIYFQRENEPRIFLQELEKDLFKWVIDGDNVTQLKFKRDNSGNVIAFDIIRPGQTITAKRD